MDARSPEEVPPSQEEAGPQGGSKGSQDRSAARRKEGASVNPDKCFRDFPDLEGYLAHYFQKLKKDAATDKDLLKDIQIHGKPKVIGDFRILRRIGKGGMATVFEAEQISLKRRVALKVLPAHLSFSDKAVRMFQREAEAGGRQHHPGIVAIYSVGQEDSMHYIAEQLVEGSRTLADHLERLRAEKALPMGYFRDAALLVAEVTDALEHAHQSGVIHRDMKPSNILLTNEGRPMVTDFGLALVKDALALSRTGDFAGTPFYMSPEQAMSRRMGIDHRTDVYSLGVTLYEMLTLRRPFDGKTSHEVLKKIILIEPKNPCKINPRVPRDLSMICMKAMEKDPSHRYQSMEEFGDDLRRFLEAELILARPSPLPYRASKWLRRHPVVSAAAGVALVALVVIIFNFFTILEERRKRQVINSFLTAMLFSPDPDRSGRENRTAYSEELLSQAAVKIDDTFPDQAEIAASLHTIIGRNFLILGLPRPSVKEFRRAAEIRRSAFGEDDLETLEAQNELANALTEMGMYVEAENLYRSVLAIWLDRLSKNDPHTINLMDSLACVVGMRGRLAEAESLHREALDAGMKILGEKDPDTLTCMNNLAAVLMELEQYDEAETLFRKVLSARQSRLRADHPHIFRSMNNLASLLERRKSYDEAKTLYQDALEGQNRFLSEEHPDTLATMNNLAGLYKNMDHFDEAENLYKKTLKIRRDTIGGSHPDTVQSIFNLATYYVERQRLSEGERLFGEIMQTLEENEKRKGMWKRDYGNRNRWLEGRAELYMIKEDYLGAEPLCREVFENRRHTLGKEHTKTLKSMTRLIIVLQRTERLEEAGELVEEALQVADKILPDVHIERLALHWIYQEILRQANRNEEAIPHAKASYEHFMALEGKDSPNTEMARKLVIGLYEQTGNTEEAARYRNK